jgi:hypothetical protein
MKKLVFVIVLLATPAVAQQQPSTAIDRVAVSLARCVSQAEQQFDQIADLQKQIAVAQAKIKELETKESDKPAGK